MLKILNMLFFFSLICTASALYKQWIPNTNFENHTNWDTGVVPCGNAIAHFQAENKVSVFVETAHAVKELRLPIVGEFIFNSGAGFFVPNGNEPGCESTTVTFKIPSTKWFDPALWKTAATHDDLLNENFIFAVHEDSVPCYFDHVIFKADSSFRVDTSANQGTILVQSVSIFGNKFQKAEELSSYLQTHTGQLQFHGTSSVSVGVSTCGDSSGCTCDNTQNRERICYTVNCPPTPCKKPVFPMGHCCNICGAIVYIQYAPAFQIDSYRQRIQHLFLALSQYKSVQVGISKVLRHVKLMEIIPYGIKPEIQVAVVDEGNGLKAEALAKDIVQDANSHGSNLGILHAEFQASSGSSSDQSVNAGLIVGVVFGIMILLALVVLLVILVNKRVVHMPSLPALSYITWLQKGSNGIEELGGPLDRGFDNPMFDKPITLPDIPSLYAPEINMSISLGNSQVNFVNPVYDEKETDFNA